MNADDGTVYAEKQRVRFERSGVKGCDCIVPQCKVPCRFAADTASGVFKRAASEVMTETDGLSKSILRYER